MWTLQLDAPCPGLAQGSRVGWGPQAPLSPHQDRQGPAPSLLACNPLTPGRPHGLRWPPAGICGHVKALAAC